MERRGFLRSLLGDTVSFCDEISGIPQLRLNELGTLPDKALAGLMPMLLPDVEVTVTEERVCARRGGKGGVVVLFEQGPADGFVFNRFNGLTPLGQIGAELADFMCWDEEQGVFHARRFFLRLVDLRVCVPGNPLEP